MSKPSRLRALAEVLLFSLCCVSVAQAAHSDPSGRVARLSHLQGDMSYSPAGEDEWVSVGRNRPLIRGDRLWTDRDARGELQVGSAAVRLGPDTSLEILELDDRIAQFRLTQGTLNLSVRRLDSGQIYEVATPTLAFTVNRAGRYRIDVDPRRDDTTIVVWEGAAEAYGEGFNFPLRAGDTVRFYGADLRDHEMFGLPRQDDFDRYSLERDRRLERSASLRYVDDDMVGYSDLDEYGSWRPVRSYGDVWFPSRVGTDWAPYRDGHWIWQEPWGWTWVDDAPWGFAPSHYGRWISVSNHWGWIPGPRHVHPIYAPALVAFVGGSGWSLSLSSGGGSPIGWFPLGPREVYVPSYRASRDYFTRVNVNNTVINNTTITNVYNNYASGDISVTQVNHVNRTVAGAITAVPADVFKNSRSVRRAAVRLDKNAATTGQVTRVAPIAPSAQSVIGTGRATRARPPRAATEREVVARHAPPLRERPFATREQQLRRNPGRVPEPRAVEAAPSTQVEATPTRRERPLAEHGQQQPQRDRGRAPERRAVEPATQDAKIQATPRPRIDATPRVRVIPEQRGAVNARADGSRRRGVAPGTNAEPTGPLPPLDRSAEAGKEPRRGTHNRGTDLDDAQSAESHGGARGRANTPQNRPHPNNDEDELNRYRRNAPDADTNHQ
ncbi:MAG: DUF6600 domain-containing protein [Immundisolibacter sp.]|uniref:DUF6600 domain-containing protein n=1 Tax=Immundisolibacter sp. TaxID=1934948 RepID=UPI003EE31857